MQYNTHRESMIREFPSVDFIRIDFTTVLKAADSNSGFERVFYIYFYKNKKDKIDSI